MEVHRTPKRKRDERSESSSTSTFSNNTTPKNLHSFIGPHFYKIIVAPSTQNYSLRIPEKYVETYYEDQLAKDCVKLKVADGRFWEIEVLKDENGRVWFKKGWEKVGKCYSLKFGDFLMFKYDEDHSQFRVWFFDTTGCELEYDKVFTNHFDTQEIIEISSEDEQINDGNSNDDDDRDIVAPEGSFGVDEKTKVIQNLEDLKNQKPCFKVCMQPRNLFTKTNRRPRLSIPMYYAKKHFKKYKGRQELILKGPNDEKSYNTSLYLHLKNYVAVIDGKEWLKFTVENELKKGDECVFEMINPPMSNMYKVTIFRLPH